LKNFCFILTVVTNLLFVIQGCEPFVTSKEAPIAPQVIRESPQKPIQSPEEEERFVKGELIVRFKNTVTNQEMEKIISSIYARILKPVSKERKTFLILLPEELSIEDAINELSKQADILYAEPNRIYTFGGE